MQADKYISTEFTNYFRRWNFKLSYTWMDEKGWTDIPFY